MTAPDLDTAAATCLRAVCDALGAYPSPRGEQIIAAALLAERKRAARICFEYAAGAAVVNAAEGHPLDSRQDIETAGDILGEAILKGG